MKCFYTILNFQLLVASPEKCFLHMDLVFSDHPGPPSGLGQRLLSSASHKGCWPPTSLMTGHQWPCPSHPAVTQLTCHSLLCLRDFYSGFYSLFISRNLFHVCHLTASYFHLRLMSTSQTRDPGQRVSWAHPPGAVISRLTACGSGSRAEPSAVWVQQAAGRERGSVSASPSQDPCPGGVTGTAALFRAKNLLFSTVSPDVGPARKEGLRLTMGTSRDALLFHLARSKRGLRCPAFK